MRYSSQRTKSMLVLMACFVLCFCWSINICASQELDAEAEIEPMGPVDVVECVFYAIEKLFVNFQVCGLTPGFNPLCYVDAITDFTFTLPRCATLLLRDFDRDPPPDPPDDETPDGLDGWCTIDACEESPILRGQCVAFMENCLAEANTDVDREQCAGSGFLICLEVF